MANYYEHLCAFGASQQNIKAGTITPMCMFFWQVVSKVFDHTARELSYLSRPAQLIHFPMYEHRCRVFS